MDQPISSLSLSSEGLWNLSDEEYLARLEWAAVVRASRGATGRPRGNVAEFTRGLQSRLKALVRSGRNTPANTRFAVPVQHSGRSRLLKPRRDH
jgi:hypothetical protein